MNMTTKEWIRHLKHYVETHIRMSAPDKSYILLILNKIEGSLFKEIIK